MNKIICSILFVILFNHSFSQKKNEFHLQLGYSQAAQLGNLQVISYWRQDYHNTYSSLEYYHNFTNTSAIGIGLQLVEKGFKNHYTIDFPGYSSTLNYFYKLNYLEMPIIYRHTFKKLFFQKKIIYAFGFLPSYLIKSGQGSTTDSDYHDGRIQHVKGSSYTPDSYKKFDAGILLRVGGELKKNLFLNLTYTQGFIRPYIYPSQEVNYQTVFMVGLSYSFTK